MTLGSLTHRSYSVRKDTHFALIPHFVGINKLKHDTNILDF